MSEELEHYAAIDLGSNSFHMVVANYVDGRAIIIDRLKDMVRLAGGLDDNNTLSKESIENAMLCLEKFGQRIKSIPKNNIRAVGTNTLRQARNGSYFLNRANKALGHQIEIISGREEARLIYLGVANTLFNDTDHRLVVDIGGGSTELIIGKGFRTNVTESLFMGCVSITKQFFANGKITEKSMKQARITALQELQNVKDEYEDQGWVQAIGTSGTIKAILSVSTEQGWSHDDITPAALDQLKKALIEFGHIDKIKFPNLSANRQPVFVGGVVILSAIFEALNINSMIYSDGALREGLLYDQIGRRHSQDIREQTIDRVANRYSVNIEQAKRHEKTLDHLFEKLQSSWQLDTQTDLKLLRWAAKLHEIGLAVSHSQYHKHGEYLLSNSDLPGFSKQEQKALSILVRSHRRKYPIEVYDEITDTELREKLIRLSIILRLSVVLNRGHELIDKETIDISFNTNEIKLIFKNKLLQNNPLTEADLMNEAKYLSSIDYKLAFKDGE